MTDRTKQWVEAEQPKIQARLSLRIENALARGYAYQNVSAPLEELDDDTLLSLRSFGPVALAQFRQVFPNPDATPTGRPAIGQGMRAQGGEHGEQQVSRLQQVCQLGVRRA